MMRTAAPEPFTNVAAADWIGTANRNAVEACSRKRADKPRSTVSFAIRIERRQKRQSDRTTRRPDGYDRMTVSTDPYALIVDDDPIILMDLDGILSDAGFRCVEADHGDAAVAMLPGHADKITLLFSDVEMPGDTDGFALARHVSSTYPWIEIVIASGRIKPEPGEMPNNATFLGKPFSARMVHDHLRERLPDGKKPEPLKKAV